MDRKQIIKHLLSKIPGIKFSYLFGSCVKGQMGPLSDIDIAVYLESGTNNFDSYLSIHHQLTRTLKQKIDLVILNEVKNLYLIESIIREGIVITDSNDDTRSYYETMMLHRILDYKHFKRMIDAA
jgi:uncharacterized protein